MKRQERLTLARLVEKHRGEDREASLQAVLDAYPYPLDFGAKEDPSLDAGFRAWKRGAERMLGLKPLTPKQEKDRQAMEARVREIREQNEKVGAK